MGAPCKADARTEILELCRDATRVIAAAIPWKDQPGGRGWKPCGLLARPEAIERQTAVEDITERRINLPSNAIRDREIWAELELVLRIRIIRLRARIDKSAAALDEAVRNTEQKISSGVSC
jgi:hypothetical protein